MKEERLAIFDCRTAGISGDMILGALADLGADISKIEELVKVVEREVPGVRSARLEEEIVSRRGIKAWRIKVAIEEEGERTGGELEEAAGRVSERIKLSPKGREFVRRALSVLLSAEREIHGGESKLHELGRADTIVDIIGTAITLEDLGLLGSAGIFSTPVAVGTGFLDLQHGEISSPAPGTLEILRRCGIPLIGRPAPCELSTPTGVALLASLGPKITSSYPPMKPVRVGYGAGERDLPHMPNVLRIVLGEPIDELPTDEVWVIETNVDDVSGELLGYLSERIMREGALDFSIIPMFAKKNRPGFILKVLAEEEEVERLSKILMREIGTLGVRFYPCRRYILPRETREIEVEIMGEREKIRIKVAEDEKGKICRIKPEFEDLKRISEKWDIPLREIRAHILRKALDRFGE